MAFTAGAPGPRPVRAALAGVGLFARARDGQVAVNNGVLVSAFVLGYFGVPTHINRVAAAEAFGAGWQHGASFRTISRVLRQRGLAAHELHRVSPQSIRAALRPCPGPPNLVIAALRLRRMGVIGEVGLHYVAITSVGGRGLYVVDPSGWEGWMTDGEFRARLAPHLSDRALVASDRVYGTSRSLPIFVARGGVRSPARYVKVTVWLHNDWSTRAAIQIARGSCDCFAGAATIPAKGIRPGGVGRVVLSFDRRRIPFGTSTREVTLAFSGPGQRRLAVVAKIYVSRSAASHGLAWFPHAVRFGVVRRARSLGCTAITVLVPAGVGIAVAAAAPNFPPVFRLRGAGLPRRDRFGRRVERFAVNLSRLPAGWVADKIILVAKPGRQKIVIPITGRVLLGIKGAPPP